jgi:hypothetical protein
VKHILSSSGVAITTNVGVGNPKDSRSFTTLLNQENSKVSTMRYY